MLKGTVRGVEYIIIGILTILAGLIALGMMFSSTHVTLNLFLHGSLIAMSVFEFIIGIMAINFGVNRLRLRLSNFRLH